MPSSGPWMTGTSCLLRSTLALLRSFFDKSRQELRKLIHRSAVPRGYRNGCTLMAKEFVSLRRCCAGKPGGPGGAREPPGFPAHLSFQECTKGWRSANLLESLLTTNLQACTHSTSGFIPPFV